MPLEELILKVVLDCVVGVQTEPLEETVRELVESVGVVTDEAVAVPLKELVLDMLELDIVGVVAGVVLNVPLEELALEVPEDIVPGDVEVVVDDTGVVLTILLERLVLEILGLETVGVIVDVLLVVPLEETVLIMELDSVEVLPDEMVKALLKTLDFEMLELNMVVEVTELVDMSVPLDELVSEDANELVVGGRVED